MNAQAPSYAAPAGDLPDRRPRIPHDRHHTVVREPSFFWNNSSAPLKDTGSLVFKLRPITMRAIAIVVAIGSLWACAPERAADQPGETGGAGPGASGVGAVTAGAGDGGREREVAVTPESPVAVRPGPGTVGANDGAGEDSAWELEPRPEFVIGVAEGAPELEFAGIIGASFLGDSLIAMGDAGSRELRIFDREGKVVRTMGRQGSGPGEFEFPSWFSTCGTDTLFVRDIKGSTLSRFSIDGHLVGKATLRMGPTAGPPRALVCGPAGTFVAITHTKLGQDEMRQPAPFRGQTSVLLIDHDGHVRSTLGTFPAGEEYFLGLSVRPRPLGKRTLIAADDERVYVGTGDSYAVTMFSANGQQLGELSRAVPLRRITRSDRDAYIESQLAGVRNPDQRENGMRQLRALSYPDEYPAYGALIVADNGSVWIGDFDPLERPPSQWRVFDRGGQLIGRITTPIGFELYEIRKDELIGRDRDADGVERVVVYRIRKTARRSPT